MPDPVPQPNGLYAHEITAPDGRLIEAYTPAPLDPAAIEDLLKQSYADQPDRAALADIIMQMEGPELPAPGEPPSAAPVVGGMTHDPVFTNDIGRAPATRTPMAQVDADPARFSDPEAMREVPISEMWDVNLDRGADDDWYGRGPTSVKDPAIGYVENDGASHSALQAQPEPGWVNKTDEYGRNWWQVPLGDDIPEEFRDLVNL